MTDVTTQHDHDGPHEGPIKTPRQLILAVFFSFVIPIAIIVLLVVYVGSHMRPAAGSNALTPEATTARIAPVGMVQVKDAADPASLKTGEQVFAAQCTACHSAGALGAPKFGDAAAWSPRIPSGYAALLHSAVAGKGNMPAQGGGDYTDFEIGRAVVYMTNQAGGHFPAPTPPVAGASAAEPALPVVTAGATAMPAAPTQTAEKAPATAASGQPAAATPPPVVVATAAQPAKADAGAAAPAVAPALYNQVCQACHALGVAGAPKVGDKAAWAPRLGQGVDGLTASAIKGKGAMPPRGGSNASDAEIKAVVSYLVSTVK